MVFTLPIHVQFSGMRLDHINKIKYVDVDDVALDVPINLYINNKLLTTIYATPDDLEELAIGFLVGEGIISDPNEISDIDLRGTDINIIIDYKGDVNNLFNRYITTKLILISCGSLNNNITTQNLRVTSNYKISISDIFLMIKELNAASKKDRRYMALHVSAIFENNKLICTTYDVNRHVAIDKVIGKAIRIQTNFSKSVLITSGRLSADMILKSGRVGIPITISLRGPLYSGLRMASSIGITCIALTRGKGLTVYTYPERIVLK